MTVELIKWQWHGHTFFRKQKVNKIKCTRRRHIFLADNLFLYGLRASFSCCYGYLGKNKENLGAYAEARSCRRSSSCSLAFEPARNVKTLESTTAWAAISSPCEHQVIVFTVEWTKARPPTGAGGEKRIRARCCKTYSRIAGLHTLFLEWRFR